MPEVIHIQLICSNFPQLPSEGRTNIYLGIQKQQEILEETPMSASEKAFLIPVKTSEGKDGSPNFTGPYVFGKTGDKFLYLVWFTKTVVGDQRFRRAKIKLRDLSWSSIHYAREQQVPITARIQLTDAKGGPICASLKPPYIEWQQVD